MGGGAIASGLQGPLAAMETTISASMFGFQMVAVGKTVANFVESVWLCYPCAYILTSFGECRGFCVGPELVSWQRLRRTTLIHEDASHCRAKLRIGIASP